MGNTRRQTGGTPFRSQPTTQATEKLTAFRKELAALRERKFDADARRKLRELIAANMGPFEYGRVVRGEKLEQNIQLRAGDVVVVP